MSVSTIPSTTGRPHQGVRPRPTGVRRVLRDMRRQWTAYLFLSPVLILFAVFTVFSVGYAFYLSFHKWNILEPQKPFVGLDNYARLFEDERFRGAVLNTAYYTAVSVPATIVLGLLVALLLNNQIRARGLFRTFFY
ncbi:MAG: sugar ABC transporter permease, partial [Chloroflexota bacterium]|nr:sugar ABC transporter permease [Chloroflexota bacterium]